MGGVSRARVAMLSNVERGMCRRLIIVHDRRGSRVVG